METYFKNLSAEDGTKKKLAQDLMTLVHDAEELIKATGENLSKKSKDDIIAALEKVKATCSRIEEKTTAHIKAAEQLIQEHPLPSMGIAFGIGVIIGLLMNKR